MLTWGKLKSFIKTLVLLSTAALILYVLCGVVCVTWDRYYYTHVSTCVAIDKTFTDVPELNINAREEIDRYLNFAFDYFKRNFKVKFVVTTRLNVSFDRSFTVDELRLKGEKLIIAFLNPPSKTNNDLFSSFSKQDTFSVEHFVYFQKNNEANKWILIHELCHQFNAIDLRDSDSIMNGGQFFVQSEQEKNGCNITFKDIDPHAELPLDRFNRKIIELSKNEYAKTYHKLEEYPHPILKKIVAVYEEQIPLVKYPGNQNMIIGTCYFNFKGYQKSLQYYLDSLQLSQNERSLINNNPLMAESILFDVEDKYAAISKNYYMLHDWDNTLAYAELIPADGKYASDNFKYSSVAYEAKGDIDSAIDEMEKYIQLKNDDASMWFYLGTLYFQRVPKTVWEGDDIDRAAEAFNKTLELDPNHIQATFHLAAIYAGNGSQEKAQEYLTKLKSANFDFNTMIQKKDGPVRLHISED